MTQNWQRIDFTVFLVDLTLLRGEWHNAWHRCWHDDGQL